MKPDTAPWRRGVDAKTTHRAIPAPREEIISLNRRVQLPIALLLHKPITELTAESAEESVLNEKTLRTLRTQPFDFPHPSISLRMTLSNVEWVRVVRFSNHVSVVNSLSE